jgi:hypothetical protein
MKKIIFLILFLAGCVSAQDRTVDSLTTRGTGNVTAGGDVVAGDDVFVGDFLDVTGSAQIDGTLILPSTAPMILGTGGIDITLSWLGTGTPTWQWTHADTEFDMEGNFDFQDDLEVNGTLYVDTLDDAGAASITSSAAIQAVGFTVTLDGTGLLVGSGDDDKLLVQPNVTGLPEFGWDESEDRFSMSKGLVVTNDLGVKYGAGTDIDHDVITIDRASTDALIEWDDSEEAFTTESGIQHINGSADKLVEIGNFAGDGFVAANDSSGTLGAIISSGGVLANDQIIVVNTGGLFGTNLAGITGTGEFFSISDDITLGAAATTFEVTTSFATVTGDAGTNTIATITGAREGQTLTILFVDGLVTITDDNSHASNSVDLSAAFTSADDTTLQLIYNGTSWYEISRSTN